MVAITLIYFLLYVLSMGLIIFGGYFMQRKKEGQYVQKKAIEPSEISVLVPFRNEEHRINGILNCIKKLKVFPKEFVFIDDHSDDDSVQVIREALHEYKQVNYSILSLQDEDKGKKKALRYAIEKVNSTYILTLDADVEFLPDYFEALGRLQEADMYVLPAIMRAEIFWEHFYEIDLVLVNAANVGLSGLSRPIMASGANLLYRRDVFNEVDNIDTHISSASGDDTYLLRDFRENKKDVRLMSGLPYAVYTETPKSFREFIDQRLRWIGKTGDLKDHLSTSLAILQSALTLVFFGVLIVFSVFQFWQVVGVVFLLKTGIDLVLFMPYFMRIGRSTAWLLIPLYELLFPIYTLVLLSLVFTYKPKWKGRAIYEKST